MNVYICVCARARACVPKLYSQILQKYRIEKIPQ